MIYMGVDCGSVSLNIVFMDSENNILWKAYERTNGDPVSSLTRLLHEALASEILSKHEEISGVFTTGSGRFIISELLGGEAFNEISTHGKASGYYYPDAKTIIEIGGQDSKLIFLAQVNGETNIMDSQMNDICAAGTGSFLDQQAYRMGVTTPELSTLALSSENPSKISGRCSVFAKTDMIHLQQDGILKEDISYGLCQAVVRTYIENLVKGRDLHTPILLQGGIANNLGVIRAFKELLAIGENELIIPEYFDIMGAIGAVLCGKKNNKQHNSMSKRQILEKLKVKAKLSSETQLKPLSEDNIIKYDERIYPIGESVYIGVDIGSVSVKLVAINPQGKLVFKSYLPNKGNPLTAISACFEKFKISSNGNIEILGVGVTGSGREYIGKCLNADIVKNEITAQVAGTTSLIEDVDVIIEIGGQDSKYIQLRNETVADFVMNKTCAAGTGSFLTEQADRLKIEMKDFSSLAFQSQNPINVGTRCTVFMETDCIHHQQSGVPKEDIVAGLSYSIAYNYIEKVATNKSFSGKIVIQGGIARNQSVVSAISNILGLPIHIMPHHEVTGALGIAQITRLAMKDVETKFVGFDLNNRIVSKKQAVCHDCSNLCTLTITKFNDNESAISGSLCGKFDKSKKSLMGVFTDVFDFREQMLLSSVPISKNEKKLKIGIPRFLLFYELFPLWLNFFTELGHEVVLSEKISKEMYQESLPIIPIDTCYPIRCIYGMVKSFEKKNVDFVFLPYAINMEDDGYDTKYAHNCQYIQQVPDLIKTSVSEVPILTHTVRFHGTKGDIEKSFADLAVETGNTKQKGVAAYKKACLIQKEFVNSCKEVGTKALQDLENYDKAFVLIGHSYIIHEPFFNLNIVKRLLQMGIPVIPADMLELESETALSQDIDLGWKTNNRAVNAVEFIQNHNKKSKVKLLPVFITQYGCAADSMLTPYLKNLLGKETWLELEVDEHNSITGMLTRCEAFWESATTQKSNLSTSFATEDFHSRKTSLDIMKAEDRTLYVYPLCEAIGVLPEVLKKHGVKSKLIDETTDHTNMLGKQFSNEKHCRTYQVMIGDFIGVTQQPEFVPEKSAFLMFDYDEACRLSMFKSLQYKVLVESGARGIDFFGVMVDDPIDWLSMFGISVALEVWSALISADYLHRYLFEVRPYERVSGTANVAYESAKSILYASIKTGTILKGFKQAMDILKNVDVEERDLVCIGVTGDGFTRVHNYGMSEIFATVEEMGGVIKLPPSWNDFINFGSYMKTLKHRNNNQLIRSLTNLISSKGLTLFKKQIENIARKYSDSFIEPTIPEIITTSTEYVNKQIAPVIPSMFIGKAFDFIENKKVDGLINAYGFNCCLGKITTACTNQMRYANDNLPMFTFVDDGLQQTNIRTRVESFMEQTWFNHRKRLKQLEYVNTKGDNL